MTSKNNKRPLTGAAAQAQAAKQQRVKADAKGRKARIIRGVVYSLLVGFLAAVAGVVSFEHIRDLAVLGGQSATAWHSAANLLPLTPDAMMIIGAIKGREQGASRLTRLICRITMLVGLAASGAGNVTAEFLLPSSQWTWLSIALAGWPVIPLLAATEMLTHTHKDARVTARKADGVLTLTRQIVRQWFINKLANMKARNASKPAQRIPVQVTPLQMPARPAFPQVPGVVLARKAQLINA